MTDTTRPEGVYAHLETYPAHSGVKDNIVVIERVNGDTSVSTLSIAREEALRLKVLLRELLAQ